MKKLLVSIVSICMASLAVPAPVQAVAAIHTIRSTGDGLEVSWQTPDLQTLPGEDGSYRLRLPGYTDDLTPGQPILPQDAVLITLPPGAEASLEVHLGDEQSLALPGPLARNPTTITIPGEQGDQTYTLSSDENPPVQPLTLEDLGVLRGVHLARLTFHPLLAQDDQATYIRQASAVVRFDPAPSADQRLSSAAVQSDPLLTALSDSLANPADLAISSAPDPTLAAPHDRRGQAAIEVEQSGLTSISEASLAAAGFPVGSVDPHDLHLERNGVEIPMEWDGDDDASFEAGEQLLFYAQPRFSRWTGRDVYFLSVDSTPRQAMPTRTVVPGSAPQGSLWIDQIFEQNHIYTPDCYCAPIPAGRDGDRWVWDMLRRPDRTSADYALDVSAVDPTQAAQITLWLIGFTNVPASPHQVQVSLNGTLLGVLTFSGKQANPPDQSTLAIPAGVLLEGENTLNLTLLENGSMVDGVWLDAFSIHYARNLALLSGPLLASGGSSAAQYTLPVQTTSGLRTYDVTDPDHPVRLLETALDAAHAVLVDPADNLPRKYALFAPQDEVSPAAVRMVVPLANTSGADEVFITPPDFSADLDGLVSLRESQGLRVAVEDVRAIYDAYSGRPEPEAIRAYLAYAYTHWNPRPLYALLVGDGTTDPRQYLSSSSTTWIPPYLVDADPVIGEIAADNRYGAVDGDDNLADIFIGRLPVNSHVEAAIMITKIVEYARHPAPGDWSQRMLLVSDRNDPNVGDFTAENQFLADAYANSRYSLTQLTHETLPSASQFHQLVLDQWNQGNGIVVYNGHASTHQWGADDLFHLNDLPSLSNGARLPVLLEMTCLTGSFQIPSVPTLDETLLRRSGRGVVASWGSTGLGLSSGSILLAHDALDQIMANPNLRLGDAFAHAKLELVTQAPTLAYFLDTFTLLGDPAQQVDFGYSVYLPAVQTGRR